MLYQPKCEPPLGLGPPRLLERWRSYSLLSVSTPAISKLAWGQDHTVFQLIGQKLNGAYWEEREMDLDKEWSHGPHFELDLETKTEFQYLFVKC